MSPSFKNKKNFYKKIDALLTGPGWECEMWEVTGDELDEKGNHHKEMVELW